MRNAVEMGTTQRAFPAPASGGFYLTPREREVLLLLCEGLSNKLISRKLDISVSTVKIHISHVLGALGARSRLEAVVIAHRLNLIGPRELAS